MIVLVVAAWEPELERFRALAPLAAEVTSRGVGVGPVAAALGTQRALAELEPDIVVLLGTCGAAGGAFAPGDVIVATSTVLVDPAALEGRAALPYAQGPLPLDPGLVAAFAAAGAKPAAIANPLGITTDDALGARIGGAAPIEHLEAFGFASACALHRARAAIVLGVANVVGSQGREQWRTNHIALSARAAEIAHAALSGLVRSPTTGRSPA